MTPAAGAGTLAGIPDQIPQTWEAAAAVFAAAPFCHVAFVEDGLPRALPVLHALEGRTLYVHGSPDSSVIRAAASGAPVSVSAVVLDGVVVAHSACQSSVNYRSVLGSGTGRRVDDPAEMERALRKEFPELGRVVIHTEPYSVEREM